MKISIQKGLFIFLLFNLKFICFTQSNAQSDINFLPESPNSKSFAKYGKYDVNMYNGVPNINIPIFEDNNNFNISLNYNINQVKPSTVPSWVGLGWHLNIGGSVTRIINGQPDEYYQNFLLPENKLSYFDNYSKLDTDQWAATSALSNFYNSGFIYGKRIPVLIPFPDEFVINIMGITGSFYMNEKGKWIGRTRDGKTFTIEHIYKSDYKLNDFFSFPEQAFKRNLKRILYGFNIIMDDGTKYVFGQDENAVEFSTNISLDASLNSIDSYNSDIIPTSWSIIKIISPKGKELKFEYQRDQKPTFVPNLAGSILKYRKKSSPGNSQALFSSEPAKGMARLYNTYLTKVQGENFTINLYRSLSNTLQYDPTDYLYETSQRYFGNVINYRNSWHKLDNLTIEDSSKKIIKNIEFTFNNQSNERLHLNKVVINNEAYSFLYNSKQLPNYTSFQKDGWGYYNGYKSPDSFNAINATPEEYEKETEQADYPNLQFAKAETLEKIIYPTGGSSSFDYELNDYSKYGDKDINYSKLKISDINTPNNLAGGLRIKNIKSCPENNSTNCITKAYSYLGDNGISSGILPYKIQHFTKATGDNYNIWEFSTSSYQALKDEGNTIGYSKVTETDSNGGKKETYYSNFDNSDFNDERGLQYVYAYDGSLALYNRLAYTSFSLMRGKPIKEIIYSDSKKITNTDFIYKKRTDYIKAYDATVNEYGSSTENGPFADFGGVTYLALVNAHNLNFNSSFLTQKTITQDNVTTTDNYEYDNVYNLQPTFEKTTHASGDIIETKYQYPYEKGNQYLIDKNMIGIPLQTTVTQKQNDNDPGKTISKSEILYPTSQADANAKTAGLALPISVLGFDLQNPDDAAKAQTEITYDLYDNKGNIFQYSVKGKPVTIIWGYNQTQPIAKIEGAAYNQVSAYVSGIIAASDADNTQGTDQSEQILIGALDILRNNTALSAYQITTYTYNPLIGVTSITPPSGIREIYKYDSANRLESVKDINGNLLKEYQYKYKSKNENTSYYNIIKSQTFTKNNCTPGTTPGTYTYTVPANKYTSTVSQADADQKAQNDINANGQEQANLFATCTPPTSCTFNPVTTGISATFTPSGSSIVYYNLNFNSSTKPYFNFDSKQNVLIGKIDLGCAPTSTFQIGKSEGGRYWMITIEPSGNFYLQLLNGSVNSGSFSISDSYSKNGSIN